MASPLLSLAHNDFDGIASCAIVGCPAPRKWADYHELASLLQGFQGELWATELYDRKLYSRLGRVVLYDHHNSVHGLLGVEPGHPLTAVYENGEWRLVIAGDRPAASMVSGLAQLGYSIPDWLARIADVLDNFALVETREEEEILAGYLMLLHDPSWKRVVLQASGPQEALMALRSVVQNFRYQGRRVPWRRVEELVERAEKAEGRIPVVVVDEDEEGLGRLAMIRLEKRYPHVMLVKRTGEGYRCSLVSSHSQLAVRVAERLGGGGRRLWPRGSVGGWFYRGPLGELVERVERLVAEFEEGEGGAESGEAEQQG